MSLRLKLIITYILMLILTVAIVIIFGVGIITLAMGQAVKGFIGDQTEVSAASQLVDLVVDLRYTEKYYPKLLEDASFATKLAEKVEPFKGFVVVKNREGYTAFGETVTGMELYNGLAENGRDAHVTGRAEYVGQHNLHLGENKLEWNNEQYFFINYNISDSLDYYFIFKNPSPAKVFGRGSYIVFSVLLLLALIIIGPVLWIVTRDIVIPLKKLDKCAREIARGNLDVTLKANSNNEIGSVIRSYEIMRLELKKSITRQLQMEESRKQLLSDITHDLKTPITSIKGYIQGIRDGVAKDEEKLSKYLDVIYTKTQDMNAMIDDLFLFSKLDLGKEQFNKDNIDILDFYENCLQELRLELLGKEVELTAQCDVPPDFKVLMDSQKIKRVILNIINNSVKFMDKEKKVIGMSISENNGLLTVRLRDNGIGIEKEELDRIFERFYRTDPSRNSNSGGSGLGLAIAKQIIEQHKGTIRADSQKGQWTEITFEIPHGQINEN